MNNFFFTIKAGKNGDRKMMSTLFINHDQNYQVTANYNRRSWRDSWVTVRGKVCGKWLLSDHISNMVTK